MDLKSIAEAYQSVQEKKLDPVGKEDGDVDNDGDKDSSDSYLMKRRAAIKKAMKKEEVEKEENDNYVNAYLGELKKTSKEEETEVIEHHQKDAEGKVIEHEEEATGTPSSVEEEKTVLEQLVENNRDIDAFEAVVSYLIDEKLAESWEQAEKIMTTLKPELVLEVYQNQLWTLFDENYRAMRNPEKYKPDDESDKPYRERSREARMKDPKRGINSPAFKKFMADRGM